LSPATIFGLEGLVSCDGATENAGVENAIRSKARVENAGVD